MKLYATVTSERATKGQGGNEFIDYILTVGGKSPNGGNVVAVVQIAKRSNGYLLQWTMGANPVQEVMLDDKGKK